LDFHILLSFENTFSRLAASRVNALANNRFAIEPPGSSFAGHHVTQTRIDRPETDMTDIGPSCRQTLANPNKLPTSFVATGRLA